MKKLKDTEGGRITFVGTLDFPKATPGCTPHLPRRRPSFRQWGNSALTDALTVAGKLGLFTV